MSTADGKTIRLRASCNACNESKVRCSQQKPTCARCERNGIDCVYGLSRRTHKDAPPISMPQSTRSRGPSRSSANHDSKGTNIWRTTTFPGSANSTPPHTGSPSCMSSMGPETGYFGDYMNQFPMQQNDPSMAPAQQFQMYGNQTSTPPAEFNDLWMLGSLFDGSTNTANVNADMAAFWAQQMATTTGPTSMPPPSTGNDTCTCHTGVTELLATMRGGNDRRLSVDAQLAKLKRCIVSSEMSMGCIHVRANTEPIHIMAVATLISLVIDEFEALASGSLLRNASPNMAEMAALARSERGSCHSSSSDDSMSGVVPTGNGWAEPRLSWGVLELEDDDEVELRQRLYLLSFRKLERLLSQLTLYLRNIDEARANMGDPSRHFFAMACDYTRMWLEKKAEDVKRLFSVSAGGETVDPSLAQHIEL